MIEKKIEQEESNRICPGTVVAIESSGGEKKYTFDENLKIYDEDWNTPMGTSFFKMLGSGRIIFQPKK